MKSPAIIIDIDGTIADCEHRRRHVQGERKDWKSFFADLEQDTPIPTTEWFLRVVEHLVADECVQVLYVTGRAKQYEGRTLKWFYDNRLPRPVCLYMRADGDFREDSIIKEEIYRNQIEPYFDVHLVLDDRDKVVKMWRKLGLTCWQVAEGSF